VSGVRRPDGRPAGVRAATGLSAAAIVRL
jgi:hypothetical protein